MGIVCYSITNAGVSYCLFMAQTRLSSAVEIRLDGCFLEDEDIREIFSAKPHGQLIATCHTDENHPLEDAVHLLSVAIMAGADYVDIDMNWPEATRDWLIRLAMNSHVKIICSYHDYKGTPSKEKLSEIARKAGYLGADIIKIVTTAVSRSDCATILSLYDEFEPEKLVAFAMGQEGYDSRLSSFAAGAPFFFVSPTRGGKTAPGQPCYFDFVEEKEILLKGTPVLPASKSFAERAILLAALAEGATKLYNVTLCDDTSAAIDIARALGAKVSLDGEVLTVEGHQNIQERGLVVDDDILFVGESALLARLCIPLAALSKRTVAVAGEKTLNDRKIDDHKAALRKFGIKAEFCDKSYIPVLVRGPLHSSEVTVNGEKGSQMISGLLLALSQCKGESIIHINNLTSLPYLDLTTYVASFFGLDCYEIEDPEDDESSRTYFIQGGKTITPVQGMEVEKDWSAAAMMMVAGALFGDITLKGLDSFSAQADEVILDLMQNLHIDIVHDVATKEINVRKSIINPFLYDITDTPDLFAPLFVLALRAEGETIIRGIKRLVNKESNRARSFVEEFVWLGARAYISGDEIHILGHENSMFRGGVHCHSRGDHRLAMALQVASLMCRKPILIDDIACVAKSYPEFISEFSKLKKSAK